MIEAASPALQPVAALRRFVVKSRVDVVMASLADLCGTPATEPSPTGGADSADRGDVARPRRSSANGTSRRKAGS